MDANGNLVTNSLSYTNSAWFTNDIPIWATNEKVGATIIKTNTDGSTTVYHIVYETNYFLPICLKVLPIITGFAFLILEMETTMLQ